MSKKWVIRIALFCAMLVVMLSAAKLRMGSDSMSQDIALAPGKTVVCGHVPTLHAWKVDPNWEKDRADIFYGNGLIAIDAGTADTGQINVLVLEG